jgi:hypothetical protein
MINTQKQHIPSQVVPLGHISGEEIAHVTHIVPFPDITSLPPKDAKAYAYLDVEIAGELIQRIAITDTCVTVGRVDSKRGITPEIDLTFLDPLSTVSRRHACIRFENAFFSLEDLESRNRTRLGESVLVPFQPTPLQHGDVVSFGWVSMVFRMADR